MSNLERVIGGLEAEVKTLCAEVIALKKDVRQLLEFKWKIYGATALIAIFCSAAVEIAVAFVGK